MTRTPWATILMGVLAASVLGTASAAPPFTLDDYRDLRPGAPILPDFYVDVQTLHGEPRGYPCTANFVFRDEVGNRYIGTAGHCADIPKGFDFYVWPYPQGPVAHDLEEKPFGRFVYAGELRTRSDLQAELGHDFPGIDRISIADFALIRIDDGVAVSPQMAHFGGPTGLNDDVTPVPVVLHQYGWGLVGTPAADLPGSNGIAFEIPTHGRTLVAPGLPNAHLVRAAALAGGGDSGSPVISADGRAVGILVALNFVNEVGPGGIDAGNEVIMRLGPQVTLAEEHLGFGLTLETAPLAPLV